MMKFSIFDYLRFEVLWLGYKNEILKFVHILLIPNVTGKNINKYFKLKLCLYCFRVYNYPPPSNLLKLLIFTIDGLLLSILMNQILTKQVFILNVMVFV